MQSVFSCPFPKVYSSKGCLLAKHTELPMNYLHTWPQYKNLSVLRNSHYAKRGVCRYFQVWRSYPYPRETWRASYIKFCVALPPPRDPQEKFRGMVLGNWVFLRQSVGKRCARAPCLNPISASCSSAVPGEVESRKGVRAVPPLMISPRVGTR